MAKHNIVVVDGYIWNASQTLKEEEFFPKFIKFLEDNSWVFAGRTADADAHASDDDEE